MTILKELQKSSNFARLDLDKKIASLKSLLIYSENIQDEK